MFLCIIIFINFQINFTHFWKIGLSWIHFYNWSLFKLIYRIVNINIAEDENEEEIIEKRRKQREELIKVCLCYVHNIK